MPISNLLGKGRRLTLFLSKINFHLKMSFTTEGLGYALINYNVNVDEDSPILYCI